MVTPENIKLLNQVDESDRAYFGWRVVLASSIGVLVGFGSLLEKLAIEPVPTLTTPRGPAIPRAVPSDLDAARVARIGPGG